MTNHYEEMIAEVNASNEWLAVAVRDVEEGRLVCTGQVKSGNIRNKFRTINFKLNGKKITKTEARIIK